MRAKALVLPLAALPLLGAAPPFSGEIAVTVTDVRSNEGVIRACITSDPEHFPECRGIEPSQGVTAPAGKRVELVFKGVRPGRYAIALLHDENGNGKADRVLMLMPKEGFGFSRDARVRMGPPKFDEAAFDYRGEASVKTIRMRYLL